MVNARKYTYQSHECCGFAMPEHLFGPPRRFDPGLHPVAKISLGLNPPLKKNSFFFSRAGDGCFFYSYEITNHLKLWNGKNV